MAPLTIRRSAALVLTAAEAPEVRMLQYLLKILAEHSGMTVAAALSFLGMGALAIAMPCLASKVSQLESQMPLVTVRSGMRSAKELLWMLSCSAWQCGNETCSVGGRG